MLACSDTSIASPVAPVFVRSSGRPNRKRRTSRARFNKKLKCIGCIRKGLGTEEEFGVLVDRDHMSM